MATVRKRECAGVLLAQWRTPNEWYFVAVCERCGLSETSIHDGGSAIRRLHDLHDEVTYPPQPYEGP